MREGDSSGCSERRRLGRAPGSLRSEAKVAGLDTSAPPQRPLAACATGTAFDAEKYLTELNPLTRLCRAITGPG